MQLWANENSGLRFAWEWAQLSKTQRRRTVIGFDGDLSELQEIMVLVLNSSSLLWQNSLLWYWCIHVNPARDRIYAHAGTQSEELGEKYLAQWNSFLRAYFLPNSRRFPIELHPCAQDYITTAGEVWLRQAPTAHEQLEAKLALRDWLRDKATPAVATPLLASLEN